MKEILQWRVGEGRWTRRLSEIFAGVQVRGSESWVGCAFATQSHNACWGPRWPLWLGDGRAASVASC